jgi:hypothetical protein
LGFFWSYELDLKTLIFYYKDKLQLQALLNMLMSARESSKSIENISRTIENTSSKIQSKDKTLRTPHANRECQVHPGCTPAIP